MVNGDKTPETVYVNSGLRKYTVKVKKYMMKSGYLRHYEKKYLIMAKKAL